MKWVEKTLKDMLDEIGNATLIKSDRIIPIIYYPTDSTFSSKQIEIGKSEKYSWLWQYEKELANFIKEKNLPKDIKVGTDVSGGSEHVVHPITGALTSVFKQGYDAVGKRKIFDVPIYLDVYNGNGGIVFTVSSDLEIKITYDNSHEDKKAPNCEISEEGNRINIAYNYITLNQK